MIARPTIDFSASLLLQGIGATPYRTTRAAETSRFPSKATDAITIGQSWACFCRTSYEAFGPFDAGIVTRDRISSGPIVSSRSSPAFGTRYRSCTGIVRSRSPPKIDAFALRRDQGDGQAGW